MAAKPNRAEFRDRINSLMAAGALPFAVLLILDALPETAGQSNIVTAVSWLAKGLLGLVVAWLAVMMVRKWRAGGGNEPAAESYSAATLLKSTGVSWVVTLVVLIQVDSMFQGNGILGITELPLRFAGEITAALMLAVFSITYFGFSLSARLADSREERA